VTNLRCDVMNCANNQNDCCCRPEIQVSGTKGSDSIFCASFVDATNGARNSIGCCLPNTSIDVTCDAEECAFNSNLKCRNQDIRISTRRNTPHSQSGTFCANYKCED